MFDVVETFTAASINYIVPALTGTLLTESMQFVNIVRSVVLIVVVHQTAYFVSAYVGCDCDIQDDLILPFIILMISCITIKK
jgi:hypothetical protein